MLFGHKYQTEPHFLFWTCLEREGAGGRGYLCQREWAYGWGSRTFCSSEILFVDTLSVRLLCTGHIHIQEGIQALCLFPLAATWPPVSPGSGFPALSPRALAGLQRVFQSTRQDLLPKNGQMSFSFCLMKAGPLWSFKVNPNPCSLTRPEKVLQVL